MDVAGVISTSGGGGGALDEAVDMVDVCGKRGWCGDGEEARKGRRCEEWEERWDGTAKVAAVLRGAEGYTDGRLTSSMCSSYEEMEMGREKTSCSVGRVVESGVGCGLRGGGCSLSSVVGRPLRCVSQESEHSIGF